MAAYYNEIEPFAAQWLRNLIQAGLIADGEVDERSIVDVSGSDLRGFTQCHFFAGIGVWSYALRKSGWSDDREVWTGSCPCQPFSSAGRGGAFDDERHLWPHFFRLIQEQRPDVVFGEQVSSKDGLAWLDFVCADLEAEDYTVGALDTCAAGVGAPHVRQRLYWVASGSDAGGIGWERVRVEKAWAWREEQFAGLVQDQIEFSVPTGRHCALADGIAGRVGRLRAYGNAIVGPQAQAFIESYMECRP